MSNQQRYLKLIADVEKSNNATLVEAISPVLSKIGELISMPYIKPTIATQNQKVSKESRELWQEYKSKLEAIVPKHQQSWIGHKEYHDQWNNIVRALLAIPKIYGQEDSNEKICYLHYFYGGSDWYITEYSPEEKQFYGFAILNGDWQNAEWGYISTSELQSSNAIELDLWWQIQNITENPKEYFNSKQENKKGTTEKVSEETTKEATIISETDNNDISLMENVNVGKVIYKLTEQAYHYSSWNYFAKGLHEVENEKLNVELTEIENKLEEIKGKRDVPKERENLKEKEGRVKFNIRNLQKLLGNNFADVPHSYQLQINAMVENSHKQNNGVLPEEIANYQITNLRKFSLKNTWEFYPTPDSVIDKMIEAANIFDGAKILEPSAGSGNILDKLYDKFKTVQLDACEFASINREILKLKNYRIVGNDFFELSKEKTGEYDFVFMNPPFADRIDIKHVRHAFEFLKPTGKLLAVMTAKSLSNSDPNTAKMKADAEKWGEVIDVDTNVMITEAEREANVRIYIVMLSRAKYLELEAQRVMKDIEEKDLEIGNYFKDTQTGIIYVVNEYGEDKVLHLYSPVLGNSKVIDLKATIIKKSLIPIDKTEAKNSLDIQLGEKDSKLKDIINQCSNINYEAQCVNGEYKYLSGLITARPQFSQTANTNYIESDKLKMAEGFNLSKYAIAGANLAIQSLLKNHSFLLADGTGAGKTVQQLLVAKYFVDKFNKPFLICTESDKILEQAFMGDASRLGISEYVERMPDMRVPEQVVKRLENNKIYLCTYYDFSLFDQDKDLDYIKYKEALKKWNEQYAKYQQKMFLLKGLDDKESVAARAVIKDNVENDPLNSTQYELYLKFTEKQSKLYSNVGEKLSGVAFDECHNLKNWSPNKDFKKERADRAISLAETTPYRFFVSATPADRAESMFYLKYAGLFENDEVFRNFLFTAGFEYKEPKFNHENKMIRSEKWVLPAKYDNMQAAQAIQNKFEDLTEDGKMLKREIPLDNYEINMVKIGVSQAAYDAIDKVEKAFAKKAESSNSENLKGQEKMETLRVLEPFKIQETIKIAENELKQCRSVVIFANLKDDGDTVKDWGDIKTGTIKELYTYFSNVYGKEKIGLITGGQKPEVIQETVAAFQNNEKFVLIATPKSGGTGISLDDQTGKRARTLICMSAPMNAEGNVQMLGRIYRLNTKSCSRAFYVFADGVGIENWLMDLVAKKMILLNATVAGEVDKMNLQNLKDGEVDDSEDAMVAMLSDETEKEANLRMLSHPLWSYWETGREINGMEYTAKLPIFVKFKTTNHYSGSFKEGKIAIRANTRQELSDWARNYSDILEKLNFNLTSDRYEGTQYVCSINKSLKGSKNTAERNAWSWIINLIFPINSNFVSSEKAIFAVGDKVRFVQDHIVYKDVIGKEATVETIRERSKTKRKISGSMVEDVIQVLYYLRDSNGNLYERITGNYLVAAKEDKNITAPIYILETFKNKGDENYNSLSYYFSNEGAKYELRMSSYNTELIYIYKTKYSGSERILVLDINTKRIATESYYLEAEISDYELRKLMNLYPDIVAVKENLNDFLDFEFLTDADIEKYKPKEIEKEIINKIDDDDDDEYEEKEIASAPQTVSINPFEKFGSAGKCWCRIVTGLNSDYEDGRAFLPAFESDIWQPKNAKGNYKIGAVYCLYNENNGQENFCFFKVTEKESQQHIQLIFNTTKKTNWLASYRSLLNIFFLSSRGLGAIPALATNNNSSLLAKGIASIFGKNYGISITDNFINVINEYGNTIGKLDIDTETIIIEDSLINAPEQNNYKYIYKLSLFRNYIKYLIPESKEISLNGLPKNNILKSLSENYQTPFIENKLDDTEFEISDLGKTDTKDTILCDDDLWFLKDKNGERRVDPVALHLLENYVEKLPQTKSLYFINGKYTDDRKKLHESIINDFTSKIDCVSGRQPVAIFTGGAPGSGKSYFLKNLLPFLPKDKIFSIDADAVRMKLPEYKGYNASSTHLETKDIVNELLMRIAQPCKHDLIIDGTMNKSSSYIPTITKLKNLGYKIYIIYVEVPKELSIERVLDRYKRTGRYVPQKVINEIYENGMKPFQELTEYADGVLLINGVDGKIKYEAGTNLAKLLHHDNKELANLGSIEYLPEQSDTTSLGSLSLNEVIAKVHKAIKEDRLSEYQKQKFKQILEKYR